MNFRKDINGLRAIAVIAVVLFHFEPDWMPGGFAGVDVFFVISGYLMTSIIFKGFQENSFSIINFYVARANRIVPALAVLCSVLLVLGWFYIAPSDFQQLGKHVFSSLGFVSNVVYWKESGYFDVASHQKWLLHTWSLSVEWQFYIIYPMLLIAMRKCMSLPTIKKFIVVCTFMLFLFGIFATNLSPSGAYYLLPARAWEMMLGGIAFLYPLNLENKVKKTFELSGVFLIAYSYFFLSSSDLWPGYLAIIPVLGAYLVIQANRNESLITGNFVFQKVGFWSYSIYLWHWPIVVAIYYYDLGFVFVFIGLFLSFFIGYLSYKFVERIRFTKGRPSLYGFLFSRNLFLCFLLLVVSFGVFYQGGSNYLSSKEYDRIRQKIVSSPERSKCHIQEYINPSSSCEYFESDVQWAVFGDSHSVEIAYVLAEKLRDKELGLKHFSFSGCKPAYKQSMDSSKCSQWYSETVQYITENKSIKNLVFNHRFTKHFFMGDASLYPEYNMKGISQEVVLSTEYLDDLIELFAASKEKVFIFYPIPELPRDIDTLVSRGLVSTAGINDVIGTDLGWYLERNKYFIDHFDNANYPSNVYLLNPRDVFCDDKVCYAVKDGDPLYFDDNHPSVTGASKLVDLIEI